MGGIRPGILHHQYNLGSLITRAMVISETVHKHEKHQFKAPTREELLEMINSLPTKDFHRMKRDLAKEGIRGTASITHKELVNQVVSMNDDEINTFIGPLIEKDISNLERRRESKTRINTQNEDQRSFNGALYQQMPREEPQW